MKGATMPASLISQIIDCKLTTENLKLTGEIMFRLFLAFYQRKLTNLRRQKSPFASGRRVGDEGFAALCFSNQSCKKKCFMAQ
jgi:hypothetical protein